MERWYVAQTNPRSESLACRHLTDQGFDTFLPVFRRTIRHARRRVETLSPLFPGYVFLRIDPSLQRWRSVNGTIGVRRLFTVGDLPLPVPEPVMAELLSRADGHGVVSMEEGPSFLPGDRVEILQGPLAEMVAIFKAADGSERVRLLLDLLGRPVFVSVHRSTVRPLA